MPALHVQCRHCETCTYVSGEFGFDYPSDYIIESEEKEENMVSFILCSQKNPFNRIEFAIYRYEPGFVATILPKEMMGELKADVIRISHRATEGLIITSQDGNISPEGFPSSRTVDNYMTVADADGSEAYVRVTSTQIKHYNVITVAWSADEQTMNAFMNIYSSFRVAD